MDCNREAILDELNDFDKRSSEISAVLEDYLSKIAQTGDTMFLWSKLKPLLRKKLELVLDEFYENCPTENLPPLPNVETFKFEILKTKLVEAVDSFQSAPFTIQRICELLTTPQKHYKRTDKFMRGLEKNILVVSTVEPKSPFDNEVNNNNAAAVMNGMMSIGSEDAQSKGVSTLNISPPPSKPSTCTSQFENFNVHSSAPSTITSEIPGDMDHNKIDSPESVIDVNSNSSSISDSTISDMEVSAYREVSVHGNEEDHCYSEHRNNYQEKSSSEVALSVNGSNTSLENFSIFTPSSPSVVSDVTDIARTEKCDSLNTEQNYSLPSDEEKSSLSTFQESCDSPICESDMDITPPPSVTDEEGSYSEDSSASSSSHSSGSDNRDFFQDVCCQSKEQGEGNVEEEPSASLPNSNAFVNSPESFVAPSPNHEGNEEVVAADENTGEEIQNTAADHFEEADKKVSKEIVNSNSQADSVLVTNHSSPGSPVSQSYIPPDTVAVSPPVEENDSNEEEDEDEEEADEEEADDDASENSESPSPEESHDDVMDLECSPKNEKDELSNFRKSNEAEAMEEG